MRQKQGLKFVHYAYNPKNPGRVPGAPGTGRRDIRRGQPPKAGTRAAGKSRRQQAGAPGAPPVRCRKNGSDVRIGYPVGYRVDTGQISYLARISLGVLCSSERTGTVPQNRHTAYRITSSPPAIQSG